MSPMLAQAGPHQNGAFQATGSLNTTRPRDLSIKIEIENPGKIFLGVNRGEISVVSEEGIESQPAHFGETSLKSIFPTFFGEICHALEPQVTVKVPEGFGTTGAIKIIDRTRSSERFWLLRATITDPANSTQVVALAESWIYKEQGWRTIFVNKFYLPSDTPAGLQQLRRDELRDLCLSDGKKREKDERVYDYDVYNDLGTEEMVRPALGGAEHPYPRRERTGRPLSADKLAETQPPKDHVPFWKKLLKPEMFYLPPDEEFSPSKAAHFTINSLFDGLPIIVDKLADKVRAKEWQGPHNSSEEDGKKGSFSSIPAIANLYDTDIWNDSHLLPTGLGQIRAPTPLIIDGRFNAWETDQEMGRQTLAGQNPCMLQALTGIPKDSKITEADLKPAIEGSSLKELFSAEKPRIFQVDYTVLSGYVGRANARQPVEGRTFFMYATRAIFYLTSKGFMRPIAIELVDVPDKDKPKQTVERVVTPSQDTNLWRLAKVYFASNDSSYHQLISHWLRTHASTEPYIIASHRNLSALHPLFALLHPHFKYTMAINRNARQNLVNAGGIIESAFTPGEFAMRISSDVYKLMWEFDKEALPADLIHRGMAVADPNGDIFWKGKRYRCVLEDYPYASDGMLIWNALRKWVSGYLNIYYGNTTQSLKNDPELQAWWMEIKEKGHPDKKTGWPALNTIEDLIDIVSTMIWIASAHHAAVNFSQYDYSGFMPNHPSATHEAMPDDRDPVAWAAFKADPDRTFLNTVSTRAEALQVMVIVQLLATHDQGEEYLGERTEGWTSQHQVLEALKIFRIDLKKAEEEMSARNADVRLISRFPDYNLLKPATTPEQIKEIRGQGIPNSVSI